MLAENLAETSSYVPYAEARFRSDFPTWFALECAVAGEAPLDEGRLFDFLDRRVPGTYSFVSGTENRFLVFAPEADSLWPVIVAGASFRGYCWRRGHLVGKVEFSAADVGAGRPAA